MTLTAGQQQYIDQWNANAIKSGSLSQYVLYTGGSFTDWQRAASSAPVSGPLENSISGPGVSYLTLGGVSNVPPTGYTIQAQFVPVPTQPSTPTQWAGQPAAQAATFDNHLGTAALAAPAGGGGVAKAAVMPGGTFDALTKNGGKIAAGVVVVGLVLVLVAWRR